MSTHTQEHRHYGFAIGLLSGTFIGAGLAILFAPRIAAFQEQLTTSARTLGRQATERIGETVEDLRRRGQDVRDNVADTVARGAHEVERFAAAAKSGRAAL